MISDKQKKILAFPYSKYDALICDGAVRSGKTSLMMWAFVDWAMRQFSGQRFGICGKTVDSASKNIVIPFISMSLAKERYALRWRRADKVLEIRRGAVTNCFEVFGGRDESSFALIQGRTLAGVLLDEVALMPRSFVEQALTRCSVEGAKLWFSCNPESPQHWFYLEWIKRHKERNALYLHFEMTDNPGLSQRTIERYQSMFTGVFYDRYIRGLWVKAEGLIYPMFDAGRHVIPESQMPRKQPSRSSPYDKYFISGDYGTLNPCAFLLWGLRGGAWYAIDEYYYSGRNSTPRTDEEHYRALEALAGNLAVDGIIVDPSAASFITLIQRKRRFKIIGADNTVIDGIRDCATALQRGMLKFSSKCEKTIEEFGLYTWDEKKEEDTPVKENDHAMDAVRYFVRTLHLVPKASRASKYE